MNENDTISRKWLLEQYDAQHEGPFGKARKLIEEAPALPREMTAREFLRDFHRLCQSMGCDECPITHDDEPRTCAVLMGCFPDETIETVEQWAKEHPEKKRKTYVEDFLSHYPKTQVTRDGVPFLCRNHITDKPLHCAQYNYNCTACWNEVIEDEE